MIVILSLLLLIMALGLSFIIYIVNCLAHCCDPLPGSPAYAKRQVRNATRIFCRSNNSEEGKVSSSDDPDDENLSKKKQPKSAMFKKPTPKMKEDSKKNK